MRMSAFFSRAHSLKFADNFFNATDTMHACWHALDQRSLAPSFKDAREQRTSLACAPQRPRCA
eukprot:6174177-Pleurochrysis_carterae.AAC.4